MTGTCARTAPPRDVIITNVIDANMKLVVSFCVMFSNPTIIPKTINVLLKARFRPPGKINPPKIEIKAPKPNSMLPILFLSALFFTKTTTSFCNYFTLEIIIFKGFANKWVRKTINFINTIIVLIFLICS